MFSQVFVCPRGGSLSSGGLCPGEGGLYPGGEGGSGGDFCPRRVSVWGSLSKGPLEGLCPGVSVRKTSPPGRTVKSGNAFLC